MAVPVGTLCCIVCCRNRSGKIGDEHGLPLPSNPDKLRQLGPDWLQKALVKAGTLSAAGGPVVESFTMEPIGSTEEGRKGMLGVMVLLRIKYKAGGPEGPATAVAKFAPTDLRTRLITDLFSLSQSEVQFYQRTRKVTTDIMLTPESYFADYSSSNGTYVLLLEFLENVEFIDQITGVLSVSDGVLHVQNLARFHARWWGTKMESSDATSWMRSPVHPIYSHFPKEVGKAYRKLCKPGALDQFEGVKIPQSFHDAFPTVRKHIRLIMNVVADKSFPLRCLIHGDTRLDNAYFVGEGEERRAGLLDWQQVMIGIAPSDISYFILAQSVDWQVNEATMISEYLKALAAHGVQVNEDVFTEWYDLSVVQNTGKALLALGSVDPRDARGLKTIAQLGKGAFAMWERRNVAKVWGAFVERETGDGRRGNRVAPAPQSG
eukprot:TRINITY_DN29631_c0_g1_i1.p1 TRINITY_DN29631_c0_g1~~TRINITY_DN29631_c0_g1_i1.p1  ORF type:complete len:433 (+),score=109.20 TRINITY_DN29631_c0_g1_i1:221-1519(+)